MHSIEDGLVVPMHVREAMWLNFESPWWKPHALKVGIGGIDALTGESFDPRRLIADPQDHLVLPGQPWLDASVNERAGEHPDEPVPVDPAQIVALGDTPSP